MSQKERERKLWCESVKRGQMTIKKASQHAGISYRQAKRIYRRYCEAGDVGLVHRGRGRLVHIPTASITASLNFNE